MLDLRNSFKPSSRVRRRLRWVQIPLCVRLRVTAVEAMCVVVGLAALASVPGCYQ